MEELRGLCRQGLRQGALSQRSLHRTSLLIFNSDWINVYVSQERSQFGFTDVVEPSSVLHIDEYTSSLEALCDLAVN